MFGPGIDIEILELFAEAQAPITNRATCLKKPRECSLESELPSTHRLCVGCGIVFVPKPQHFATQQICGDRKCKKRRDYKRAHKKKAFRVKNINRCKAWYQQNSERHKADVAARRAAGSSLLTQSIDT